MSTPTGAPARRVSARDVTFVVGITAITAIGFWVWGAEWSVVAAGALVAAIVAVGLAWRWKRKPMPCDVCGRPATVTTGTRKKRNFPLQQGTFCDAHMPTWMRDAMATEESGVQP